MKTVQCRRTKIKKIIIFVLLFSITLDFGLWTLDCHAGDFSASAKGTTAAGFLKLPAGAKAAALGEAYGALVDDASALYWNPAALNAIENRSMTLMHAFYLESTAFDYAAYAQKIGDNSALGLSLQYFSAGSITETDETGTEIGDFNPNDLAISIGYAHQWGGLSLGANVKMINTTLIETAQTWAADIGILSRGLLSDRLRLSAGVSNLGGTLTYEEEDERLPLNIRLGSALLHSDHWKSALDVDFPIDNDPYVALGSEYSIDVGRFSQMAIRAGLNSRTWGDIDGLSGLSFGLGFSYDRISTDYAVVPLGDLGWTHRLSLNWNF